MSIREWMENYCVDRGMFGHQARAVVEAAMADQAEGPMAGHWDRSIEGYPPNLCVILEICLKRAALDYIEANCPEAWFRPLFENGGAK